MKDCKFYEEGICDTIECINCPFVLPCLCENCIYFTQKDRYCKKLQINWIPNNFACNKGKKRKDK